MRGVILAGGNGSRLNPLTIVTNKHLLPVYKKPMIFYPIETMVKCGVKELMIITSGEYIGHFYKLLGVGEQWGIHIHYEIQNNSNGTGAALLCAREFVKDDEFLVILGDNIIYEDIKPFVDNFETEKEEFDAKVLITRVERPERYGVVEYDETEKKITRLVEKPKVPFSHYINTGLWIFKPEIFDMCMKLKKSARDEYEITDVLAYYAEHGKLTYDILKSKWTDAGTFEQLYEANMLMRELERSSL